MHELQRHEAGDILDGRHAQGHAGDEQHPAAGGVRAVAVPEGRQQVQDTQA